MTLDDMNNLMGRMGTSGRDYRDFSEQREPRAVSDGPRDWLLLQELGDTAHPDADAWREVVAAAEAFVKPEITDSSLQDEFSAMLSWVVPEASGAQATRDSTVAGSTGGSGPVATSFDTDDASVGSSDPALAPDAGAAAPPSAPQVGRLFQRYAVASRTVPVRATPVRSILARVAS